ncbi:hypothetical protein BDZ45DRAFT_800533 [Acephala macrosclerotiorum]|nr:hypothetical protein BDZ45DRAFT_800533 [Acephala macrosclerotiorum]
MINLEQLEGDLEYNLNELENYRLRRLLYATARQHNRVFKELESLKDANGFYEKPFPLLRHPSEIRDRIYLYSLRAPITAEIYLEAIEILYSKNIISFHTPQELFEFEEQIRASNRDLVQEIRITVLVDASMENFDFNYDIDIPSRWAMASPKSRLGKAVRMTVEADFINATVYPHTSMPTILQKSIEGMFSRNQSQMFWPRLVLQGFSWGQKDKFPDYWDVMTERWWEEEMRAALDKKIGESGEKEYLQREQRILRDLIGLFGSKEAFAQLQISDQAGGPTVANSGFSGTGRRKKVGGLNL